VKPGARRGAIGLVVLVILAVAAVIALRVSHPAAPAAAPTVFAPASSIALTCDTIPGTASGPVTVADALRVLAADDQAIGGNWTAAETPDQPRTAAQTRALDDLTVRLSALGDLAQAQGPLATRVSELYNAASWLTSGNPGWQGRGPVVHDAITALAASCPAGDQG
jgi:hypothetical protein